MDQLYGWSTKQMYIKRITYILYIWKERSRCILIYKRYSLTCDIGLFKDGSKFKDIASSMTGYQVDVFAPPVQILILYQLLKFWQIADKGLSIIDFWGRGKDDFKNKFPGEHREGKKRLVPVTRTRFHPNTKSNPPSPSFKSLMSRPYMSGN